MRNLQLEAELAAQNEHNIPPLTWWRCIPANVFIAERAVVETSVASVVSISRLAPPNLIAELLRAQAEEKSPVFLRLATHFLSLDAMHLGILWDIGGSCAALAAADFNTVGLLRTLKALSEPYISAQPERRLAAAATWLAEMGTLLNPVSMAEIDWNEVAWGDYDPESGTSAEWPE